MCRDLDLFGEVVVTLDDVEIWLRSIPRFMDITRPEHISDYIRGYDVVNKIKHSKLRNEFYSLNYDRWADIRSLSLSVQSHFKPKYTYTKISTYANMKRLEKLAFIDPMKPRKPRGNFRRDVDLRRAA